MDRIDMSLDDIIKQDKVPKKQGNPNSRAGSQKNSRGGGAIRSHQAGRQATKASTRPYTKKTRGDTNVPWKHDLFTKANPETKSKPVVSRNANVSRSVALATSAAVRSVQLGGKSGKGDSSIKIKGVTSTPQQISIRGEAGPATILISNLDRGASAQDIQAIFSQFGEIRKCTLLYDQNSRPTGNAEIIYSLKASAQKAINKLNNVIADGRTLSIILKDTGSKGAASYRLGNQKQQSAASGSGKLYSDRLPAKSNNGGKKAGRQPSFSVRM
ncbi:hypothetical protein K493DRAFT_336601 [Basidiobolus meristosporus CBS 931.73]|uniref:RRM domain-containing protein n=1 Tax=Basidiobolus meristosporus CBS 931.73 TaxID=1314790 RepID=A0A1Y1YH25_9FUNG|nr:hypothetical protein K493DRAFT_336601 [Basidiobolus meristosporus CBS 931.73]|eukprot:ORX97331.1 hypothetical protein K493DRAFT_336601 [Basidiobolus meristosporus CBS 931.73]